MIIYTTTNLFLSPAQTLVNTVNTDGVMGKGIAKTFKRYYPQMFKVYRETCRARNLTVGQLVLHREEMVKRELRRRWVLNFPTKIHWRNHSELSYIESGLQKFVATYRDKKIESVSFPQLGVGNGGLDWPTVHELMRKYLEPLDIPVYIHIYHAGDAYDPATDQTIRENLNSPHDSYKKLNLEALFQSLAQQPHVNADGVVLPASMEASSAALYAHQAEFHELQTVPVMVDETQPSEDALWFNERVYRAPAQKKPSSEPTSEQIDLF